MASIVWFCAGLLLGLVVASVAGGDSTITTVKRW